jgi:hypothetical protein
MKKGFIPFYQSFINYFLQNNYYLSTLVLEFRSLGFGDIKSDRVEGTEG